MLLCEMWSVKEGIFSYCSFKFKAKQMVCIMKGLYNFHIQYSVRSKSHMCLSKQHVFNIFKFMAISSSSAFSQMSVIETKVRLKCLKRLLCL